MSEINDVFGAIGAAFESDKTLAKKIGGVLHFALTSPSGNTDWVVDGKAGTVKQGAPTKADCTITLSQGDFGAMVSGKLNGMSAFMSGKMKIKGNMALAQKFQTLTDAAKKAGLSAKPAAAAAAPAAPPGFQSTPLFEQITANIKADPSVAKKVNGVFLFNISGGPGGSTVSWTVDAKGNPGVRLGKPPKADCTIAISDADFVGLASGKLNGMSAFMSGKMKVTGNMGLAQKLDKLVKAEAPKAKL
jgi:3-hydroxyacyl-CoA dehydrogenase/3a,7a,12a-trihydroxy-5b-cholest-24-enoyl-CoA hydratase